MVYSGKEIVARIKRHVKRRGGAYSAWFVDVANDARSRLFKKHGVLKDTDRWILVHAESPRVARSVRTYFVEKLGASGAKSQKDESSDYVYAYKKNAHTKP